MCFKRTVQRSFYIMNITIICDVLGEPNNGTTIATLNLINFLQKQGHIVRVVCPDQDKKEKKIITFFLFLILEISVIK